MYENIVKFPEVLFVGSLLLLVPLGRETNTIRKIVWGYMAAVYVNLLGFKILSFGMFNGEMNVVCDIFIIIPLVGYLLFSKESYKNFLCSEASGVGLISLIIMFVHLAFLFMLLMCFYGYGFGRDLYIIWQIVKFLPVFIFVSKFKPGLFSGLCNYFIIFINGSMAAWKWLG